MNQMYRFVLFLVVFYALIGKHFNCLAHQQPVSVPTTPYNNEFAFEFIFFSFNFLQLFYCRILPLPSMAFFFAQLNWRFNSLFSFFNDLFS